MKTKTLLRLAAALIIGSHLTLAVADTVCYATLCSTNTTNPVYLLTTNQLITQIGAPTGTTHVTAYNSMGSFSIVAGSTYTGLTSVALQSNGGSYEYVAFQITTPAASTGTVSNTYLPADALVIPTSVTGNVNLIMESSADLLNWSAATPGQYGMSTGANRFFRLRAVVQ